MVDLGFHLKVTGLRSLIKSKPQSVLSVISSLYLSSDGAVIDVAPKAILLSLALAPNVKLFVPIQETL